MPVKKPSLRPLKSLNTKSLFECSVNSISNLSSYVYGGWGHFPFTYMVRPCLSLCCRLSVGHPRLAYSPRSNYRVMGTSYTGMWTLADKTRMEEFAILPRASLFTVKIVAEFPLPYTNSGSSLYVSGWRMAVSTHYGTLKHIFPHRCSIDISQHGAENYHTTNTLSPSVPRITCKIARCLGPPSLI